MPPLLSLQQVNASIGDRLLFENVTAHIYERDRICIIGRNGCGKSTLLSIMAGIRDADEGEVYRAPNLVIGYLGQAMPKLLGNTIYDHLLTEYPEEFRPSMVYQLDQILEPLGLSGEEITHNLSGGKLRRLALAQVLLKQPQLLLLDEPTNHLDISAILWLEEFIKNFNGAVVIISHDRAFLRKITTNMWWVNQNELLTRNANYSEYLTWQEEYLAAQEQQLSRTKQHLAREEWWLQHGVTARRKRNQQRLANLFDLREQLSREHSQLANYKAEIGFSQLQSTRGSKVLLELDEVSFTYPNAPRPTLSPFSTRLLHGEKLGILGSNGAGKSTLLKLIIGELKPTQGNVKLGKTVNFSYLDQKRDQLNPTDTLKEALLPSGGDTVIFNGNEMHVHGYLQQFLFSPSQFRSAVGKLSGGEQHRLLLAKLFLNPGNLLILDEPTNDLDLETIELLQQLLSEFTGTAIIVSHDREFLEQIVTRTWVYNNTNITNYYGGLADADPSWFIPTNHQSKTKPQNTAKPKASKPTEKHLPKLSYKETYELEQLPELVSELEKKAKQLEQKMEITTNYQQLAELSKEYESLKADLTSKENRWLELLEKS